MQFWSEKSEKREISPTCDSRPQLIRYPRHPIPCLNSIAVASTCASRNRRAHVAVILPHSPARPSGPLNVFDPWSKLFYKYTHVRRAWPSLGQVHSEFGSELEQPLASRPYIGPRGGTCQINSLKRKNTRKSQNISQTLASLPGTQMIVQSCFLDGTNQCPKIIKIVILLLSFLTVTPRGTLDFKALYVTLCVSECVRVKIHPGTQC